MEPGHEAVHDPAGEISIVQRREAGWVEEVGTKWLHEALK